MDHDDLGHRDPRQAITPLDLAVLCADCGSPVRLVMFVDEGWAKRQVRCPACASDVVLRDAW